MNDVQQVEDQTEDINRFIPNKDLVYKLGPLNMEQVGEIMVLLKEGALVACCNCGDCGYMHASDCGVHSGPEFVTQRCDCRDGDKPVFSFNNDPDPNPHRTADSLGFCTGGQTAHPGEGRCAYCHGWFPSPVHLHHSEDECV